MSRAKIEISPGNKIKKEKIKNNEIDKNFLAKINYFVDFQLISEFKNILNVPKIDFLSLIMLKLKKFLFNEYLSKNIDENNFKYLMVHMKEKWEKKYDNHVQNLSTGWENYQIIRKNKNQFNEIEQYYFKDFVYHCSYISEYAIHNCDKVNNIFGKFIIVYDYNNINNKNTIKYVICENCRKAYFIEHFLNYCEKCKVNYYTSEIHEKKDFFQATLKTPHCEPVVNEKIHCSHCNSALYLNPSSNLVKCLNCRFVSSPNNIEWNCNICSKPFKSDVIIYNKCEVNFVKKIINYGLLIKKRAHPAKLPCCKNINLKTTPFYHKKNCKGIIYFAEFHKKLIIICEKCKAVNNFGKFIWTCPQCNLRFKDMKWQENEPKIRKEIFNDKNKLINDEEEVFKSNKNLATILNNELDINNMTIKKKKNLYDILQKRIEIIPEKLHKDNKELSTEGSDSKNINYINQELLNDNIHFNDLIKVKRNNIVQINNNNNINNNNIIINNNKALNKKKEEKINIKKHEEDLLSNDENKKSKKRYIFEKLIRRQFISSSNIKYENLITEVNPQPEIKLLDENLITTTEINKNISSNNMNKKKILVKNKSNSDLRGVQLVSRMNKNKINKNIVQNNSEVNSSKNKKDIINNDIIKEKRQDIKSNYLLNSIEKELSSTTKERKYGNKYLIIDKNNNSPKDINNNNNNRNLKKYFYKKSDKNSNENKPNNILKNIPVQNDLNNTGYRKINKENFKKNNDNNNNNKININLWSNINHNSKSSENKEFLSTGNTISKNNSKYNSNKDKDKEKEKEKDITRNDSPYSSTSIIALKNNSKNKKPISNNNNNNNNEDKSKYDNSTFRNKRKNLINKFDSNKTEEEEIPNDIVKITSIDKMEKIPLNPAIFTNPLLANNIQQRIKHILFRGKLPLFNVDNYTIKKTLGEGTNGVIYQVMNNTSKKLYAMKKLIASTIAELDYLQKEFQICYQNPHESVLTIYGVCVRCFDSTTYVLYVLMPLAEKDLEMEISERIRRKKYYKENELIIMIKQLVKALYYLQKERNVAHRDIKPENILIFKNHILKLADFGEAKVNNNNKKKKTIRGTEFYMSPILYEGNMKSKYDIQHNPFKSDVFSLGYCFICASSLDPEVINEIRQIKDMNKIKTILKKYFPKEYSPKYINLLLKMITLDENERVDFIGLEKILEEY